VIEHHETRFVPYPAETMYAVVSDVEKYPKFLPWVVALRVLARRGNGLTAEMAVGYGALRERYTSDIALDEGARTVEVTQTTGPFRVLENRWRFTPNGEGCDIEFSIRFEFKSRLLQGVAGAKFEKAMLKMTDAFVARARELQEEKTA
jgi:coenzyme Q-binding protein COQ10